MNKIGNKGTELASIDRKSLSYSRFLNNWVPLILLGSAGLFGWAIRGCSGFGAVPGCVFAGTLYAAVWYGLGKENTRKKTRRYNSGWSILTLIFGIGISGAQGWMQWPNWVKGELVLNANIWPNITTSINPFWGYEWWFIVAVHWGGLGAIFLAWTGSQKTLTWKEWILRIAFTVGGGIIAYLLFIIFPGLFLPPAEGITTSDYLDWVNYPALQRAFSNNLQAITFLGIYLGGLAFEIYHRDWINVKLIVIVGVITGLSWDFFQIWQFVGNWFPTVGFNWLRCWETSAGLGIGLAYGCAFIACNKSLPVDHRDQRLHPYSQYPALEKVFGIDLALIVGMGWSLSSGIKGFLNIYYSIDETLVGWALPIGLLGGGLWIYLIRLAHIHRVQFSKNEDIVPYYGTIFFVLYLVHRVIGLQVTGPLNNSSERAFFIYYLILSLVDLITILSFLWIKRRIYSKKKDPLIDDIIREA